MELSWIALARTHIGQKEVKGPKHNPRIVQWWKDIRRGGIKDDETPWCAAFAGAMLELSGIQSSRFESARSYLPWGLPIEQPAYGCIVVFERSSGGHVGFVVGKNVAGNLLVLGGNQGDGVSIAAFSQDRVLGFRWPIGQGAPNYNLALGSAPPTTGEA